MGSSESKPESESKLESKPDSKEIKYSYDINEINKYCTTSKHIDTDYVPRLEFTHQKWLEYASPLQSDFDIKKSDIHTISSDLDIHKYTHSGLIQYVAYAWITEKGIVLRPDMFHHAICCEISTDVITNPSQYRDLYTTSPVKTDINITMSEINSDDAFIKALDNVLDEKIPNKDFKKLFTNVQFETQPDTYEIVKRICFTNSATPFYNFARASCGIPSITIVNVLNDWQILHQFIIDMQTIISSFNVKIFEYLKKCEKHIKYIIDNFTSNDLKDFLREIFYIEDSKICMSGHLIYNINGWLKDFYSGSHDYINDYPSHLPYIPYTHMDKNMCLISGLIVSDDHKSSDFESDDQIMNPEYGRIKLQILSSDLFDIIKH
jgi:hypothetical protein